MNARKITKYEVLTTKYGEYMVKITKKEIEEIIKKALEEDLNRKGDLTTEAIPIIFKKGKAIILAKEEGILAGLEVCKAVFNSLDKNIIFKTKFQDGKGIKPGNTIVSLEGNIKSILTAERTALNVLSHLSGIATLTNKFVQKTKPYRVKLLDTRKTIPGLRKFEKYAVKKGGGFNHRLGLYDGIIIKDSHIKAAGGIKEAVKGIRKNYKSKYKIEVEAKNLNEVKEAIEARSDLIMLDNMKIEMINKAKNLIGKRVPIEVSGGVNLSNIREIAKIGVDFISIGRLTNSAPALDISLELKS